MTGYGGRRVRQFIDERELRFAPQHAVQIHFLQPDASVFDRAEGPGQSFCECVCVLAAMGLQVTDHHVTSRGALTACSFQHGIRLSHARREAEKHLSGRAGGGLIAPDGCQQRVWIRSFAVAHGLN